MLVLNGSQAMLGTPGTLSCRSASTSTALQPSAPTQAPHRQQQGNLLILCLLEKLCRLYDRDPEHNRRLFHSICRSLSRLGVRVLLCFGA